MKVLDLQCASGHAFEGWFASEDDFQAQLGRSLVACPLCASTQITKLLSAPRLNLSGARHVPDAAPAPVSAPEAHAPTDVANLDPRQLQAAWMKAVQHVMAQTEDVGARFAQEARKMHYGETEERGIRGQATPQETRELLEEGIQVVPLPVPEALKGPVH